jgi:aflatoxin B1 aldehyde reductase
MGGHEVALRWTVYHSMLDGRYGDAVVIAASSVKQLQENLDMYDRGPLPAEIAAAAADVYAQIGSDAPAYYR